MVNSTSTENKVLAFLEKLPLACVSHCSLQVLKRQQKGADFPHVIWVSQDAHYHPQFLWKQHEGLGKGKSLTPRRTRNPPPYRLQRTTPFSFPLLQNEHWISLLPFPLIREINLHIMSAELIISLPSCLSNWFLLEFGLVTEFKATMFLMIEYEIKQRINVFYPSSQLWALSVLKLSILKLAGRLAKNKRERA